MGLKRYRLANFSKGEKVSVGLFFFALFLRLFYLSQIRTNPFFEVPIVDSKTYFDIARQIVSGDWLAGNESFWQPPFYPYFLAILLKFFGEVFYSARLIQFVLGAFSCVLTYLIGRQVFNHRIGLTAGFLASIYGILIYFEGELLPASIATFLDLACILILLRGSRTYKEWCWLLAGIILGISALTIANTLLFAPLAAIWIWYSFRRKEDTEPIDNQLAKGGRGKALQGIVLFVVGCLLIIAPVTARNFFVSKEFVLISYNSGINFYVGNNPDYDRTVGIRPGSAWEELFALPFKAGIQKPSERSRFFFRKSWAYISTSPLSYARLIAKKNYLFWTGDEIKRNQDIYYFRNFSSFLKVIIWKYRFFAFPFGLLGPLALLGIVFSLRHLGERRLLLVFVFTLTYVLSVVAFFVVSRYRVPVIPFLLMFAAYGVSQWLEAIRYRRYRVILLYIISLAVLIVFLNFKVGEMNMEGDAEVHYNLGYAYAIKKMYVNSIVESQKAIELNPNYFEAHCNLGSSYATKGLFDDAIDEYRRALEIRPDRNDVRNDLSKVLIKENRYDEAIVELKKIVEALPKDKVAYFQLGFVYGRKGAYNEAIKAYKKSLALDSNQPNVHYNLAFTYGMNGMVDEAMRENKMALKLRPNYVEAMNNLAIEYTDKGMYDDAISELQKVIRIKPDYVDALYNLAVTYYKKGMYDKAIKQYNKVLQIKPDYDKVHYNLSLLYTKIGQAEVADREFKIYIESVRRKKVLEEIRKQTKQMMEQFKERGE